MNAELPKSRQSGSVAQARGDSKSGAIAAAILPYHSITTLDLDGFIRDAPVARAC